MADRKESQTVEFKQVWKDEYLKTICAFANSDGGVLSRQPNMREKTKLISLKTMSMAITHA